MNISAKVLLLAGNVVLGIVLLSARPRVVAGMEAPRVPCCKHDTAGYGVCCADCCLGASAGCMSSSACPGKART